MRPWGPNGSGSLTHAARSTRCGTSATSVSCVGCSPHDGSSRSDPGYKYAVRFGDLSEYRIGQRRARGRCDAEREPTSPDPDTCPGGGFHSTGRSSRTVLIPGLRLHPSAGRVRDGRGFFSSLRPRDRRPTCPQRRSSRHDARGRWSYFRSGGQVKVDGASHATIDRLRALRQSSVL
jgi:hypothetical protein